MSGLCLVVGVYCFDKIKSNRKHLRTTPTGNMVRYGILSSRSTTRYPNIINSNVHMLVCFSVTILRLYFLTGINDTQYIKSYP